MYDNNLSGTWQLFIQSEPDANFIVRDHNLSARHIPLTREALLYSDALSYLPTLLNDLNVSELERNATYLSFRLTLNQTSDPASYLIYFSKVSDVETRLLNNKKQLARSLFKRSSYTVYQRHCGFGLEHSLEYTQHHALYFVDNINADIQSAETARIAALSNDLQTYDYRFNKKADESAYMPFLETYERHLPVLNDDQCYTSSYTQTTITLFKYDDYSEYITALDRGITLQGTWTLQKIISLPVGGSLPRLDTTGIAANDVPLSVEAITTYETPLQPATFWIPKKSVVLSSKLVKWSVYQYGGISESFAPTIIEYTFTKEP